MKKSIKTRLVISFMMIIIITVLILEIVALSSTRDYYHRNLEDILKNDIKLSLEYYSRYYSSKSIEEIILDDSDVFWKHTNAQVQIFTSQGQLLMDSLGAGLNKETLPSDIQSAMGGDSARWIGRVDYDTKPVMAYSAPVKDRDEIVGIIRFVTSMEETNRIINRVSLLIIVLGLAVIVVSGLVSVIMANSLIIPLKKVTETARKMADGELHIRSDIELEDEIGQLANTLNYMAEELIKKEELKNEFISSISHELRTPLTSIKGWAITLKSEDIGDNEIIRDGLDIIEKEGDRLGLMVEELLDFSKFVSEQLTLDRKLFLIEDTIRLMGKQSKPRARLNGLEFQIDIEEDLGYISADENRLKQVIINLLDNAFKFTEEGGSVVLKAFSDEEDIIIEVIDTGAGIAEEELPKVKERFYKGKNSKSNTGLGLSISEEIIKMHGGSMDIASILGQGTSVKIRLPKEELGA